MRVLFFLVDHISVVTFPLAENVSPFNDVLFVRMMYLIVRPTDICPKFLSCGNRIDQKQKVPPFYCGHLYI